MLRNIFNQDKTFKPKKNIKEGSKRFELHKQMKATLGSGDLRGAVKLPPGEDLNEWLAVNIIDFFNQINLLYGSITEFCTPKSCPVMSAGPKYEYLWADGKDIKKPLKVSAPEYADYLMTWVQNILEDETIFPTSEETPFPKTFKSTVKTIFKRLFRIYAHIYYSHAQEIVDLGVEAHLNTAFKHFYLFIEEFDLVEPKEMVPLEHEIEEIHKKLQDQDGKEEKDQTNG
jgi:MOB kinase activator 1